MGATDIRKLTIAEASKLIENKEITPSELLESYLKVLEAREKDYIHFIDVYESEARLVAEGLDKMQQAGSILGPLHGIPIAIKANIGLKGHRRTAGSGILKDQIYDKDAFVTAQLKSNGAVIVGSTNMDEFAWGATVDTSYYGTSHNPWDLTRYCSGSSGGSGGAVAGGTVMCALGTDTGGSVRLPSAINGLVGLRPTVGRVSNYGIVPCGYTLDTCGPMTRTVMDNAILMNIIAGHDYHDPTTSDKPVEDYTAEIGLGIKGIRIGVLPQIMHTVSQPDVDKAVDEAIDRLRDMGAQIIEYTIPDLEKVMTAWTIINSADGSVYHQKEIRRSRMVYDEEVRALLEAGEVIPATVYLQAARYRQYLMNEFRKARREVDAFVYPTIPCTALKLDEIWTTSKPIRDLDAYYTCIGSLTGLPAMSIPCGQDHDGLPVGLQILGKPFGEKELYRIAAAFEKEYNLYDQLPAFR